ncbi:MAG: hypothetical protein M0P95_11085 [Sulfuritalea sp.]|jgi:hypothetical protein|nr:hypothetical protein [Sulfuritalea sp.]
MPIEWSKFEEMFFSVKESLERLRALAEKQIPSDRADYDQLCNLVLDTTSKMLESTGSYTPDITDPALRKEWKKIKNEAESIRTSVLNSKGRLWPHQ